MSLLRKLIQRTKNQRGVTLIELLAVIIILGIIAAIGIPAVVNSRDNAEQATYETNSKVLSEAIRKRILFGETYSATSAVDSAGDNAFSIPEVADEVGITNLGTVTGTGTSLTVDVNDGSTAVGTYTVDVATGSVTYAKK